MKHLIVIVLVLAGWQSHAQTIMVTDTAAMLAPYFRKADTAVLSNQLNAVAQQNLQQITGNGNTTTGRITAASLSGNYFTMANTATSLYALAGTYLNNNAAAVSNRNIVTNIQNNQAGGGGISQFFTRHGAYDGGTAYYNILAYTLTGAGGGLTLGGPAAAEIKTATRTAIYINRAGNAGIGTTVPVHSLQVKGNAIVEEGKVLVNTTSTAANGAALQVNGTANITGRLVLGNADTLQAGEKLLVNGNIRCKRVIVKADGWADYVFDTTYQLPSLATTEQFVRTYHHLPGVPPASEITAQPADAGDLLLRQQVKLEELTLYMIQLSRKQAILQQKIKDAQQMLHLGKQTN